MVWGAVLGVHILFLLLMCASGSLGWSGKYRQLPPCITWQIYVNHLGAWIVRRINGTAKREEVVNVFGEGKFKLLALMKTKLKGNGELSWCGVKGIIAGVQEMETAREGVTILLNDVWHSTVVDFGCISSRIFWIKFKFSRVKVCVVVGCGSNEGDGEKTTWTGIWIE